MTTLDLGPGHQQLEGDWVGFPGGELEGRPVRVLCPTCRAVACRGTHSPGDRRLRTLCFACYRSELDRRRVMRAAGQIDTASNERFQQLLPLESVNRARLDRLRAERVADRAARQAGIARYAARRRRAQIVARHALGHVVTPWTAEGGVGSPAERALASAIRASDLQLPSSWLPFVVSR